MRRTGRGLAVVAMSMLVGLSACGRSSNIGSQDAVVAADASPPPRSIPSPVTPTPSAVPTAEPGCDGPSEGFTNYELEVLDVTYSVGVHVPPGLSEPAPVVVMWHGLGGSGAAHTLGTGYFALADEEGFLVVAPTGIPIGGDDANAWELVGFDAPGRDDVAFASALIDDVIDRFCGDPDRVYSTGFSNGGLFTSRLVCELSDKLAAASAVGGVSFPDGCQQGEPVPFIAYHGTDDLIVPFDAVNTASFLDHPIVAAFEGRVISDEFAKFAAAVDCGPDPRISAIEPDVVRHDYLRCAEGVVLSFFEVTGGGHDWPGSGVGAATGTVDATRDSWAFFAEHTRGS